MAVTSLARKMLPLIAGLSAALLLAACASSPKVFTNENPAAKFGAYKTYNYEQVLGTDDEKGYRSILSNYFISAMDRELATRGFSKSDNPDLIVNFYVATEEKIRTTSTPTMGGYYGYRGGYYGAYGGYETRVTQYTEGTVNIDLVDNELDELAWEGVTVGRITDKVRENLELAVSTAVSDVMSTFPHYAAGFVPPPPADGETDG